jgi:hypothetical protein
MFLLGKTIKYSLWAAFAFFIYHMILIKKYEKPEEKFFVN